MSLLATARKCGLVMVETNGGLSLPTAEEINFRLAVLNAEVKRLKALLRVVEGKKPKPATEAIETN